MDISVMADQYAGCLAQILKWFFQAACVTEKIYISFSK